MSPLKTSIVLALTAVLSAAAALAQGAPSNHPGGASETIEARLLDARLTMTHVAGGGFDGPGWEAIAAAVETARFVALGEDHMTREIPAFAEALCRRMGPDLSALAIEASPTAALFVERDLRSPDRLAHMKALLARHPNAVAFLDMAEENDLAAACAKASGKAGFHLWGLDQEFVGSADWLLDQILAEDLPPAARAAVSRLRDQAVADAAEAASTGDPSKLFTLRAPEADLATADSLVAASGSARARALMTALRDTCRIYRENAESSPDANGDRARLLKRTLAADLDAAEAAGDRGKILIKMGDWHIYRGYNPLHERDLGNWLAERADAEGTPSLHIAVLGVKGVHVGFAGYGKPLARQPFVMTDDPDYVWLGPAAALTAGPAWSVFDLRKLRARHLSALPPDWRKLAEGFDLLVLAPALTPATAIAP